MLRLGLKEIREKIKAGEISSYDITREYIEEIKKSDTNAIIEVFEDALDYAKLMDNKIAQGYVGKLAGVPIVIKDNILMQGKKATAASKILMDYVAQYSSTVVKKLLDAGAVIIGRANMDEFAMGSGTENSYYGNTLNPLDKTRVPGGSSGGSAAAVAGNLCAAALGTDTGGSVRQPASCCGCVGFKPTYGRVSRFGVIAFASSLDQVGPITKNVEDNALLLEVIAGYDENDMTTSRLPVAEYTKYLDKDIKGMRVGVIKQVDKIVEGLEVEKSYKDVQEFLRSQGAEIVEINIPSIELALPVYYIISPAEATSNLARFDGVKYTIRDSEARDLEEIYKRTRTKGFGAEVKRRIMMGNYVLSSGYFDAYYNKAKALQGKLKKEFADAFNNCDVLITPTAKGEAFKIGEKQDPIDAYKEDIFTVPVSIVGVPAISIPYGTGPNNLPLGLQFIANHFDEGKLYQISDYIEKHKGE